MVGYGVYGMGLVGQGLQAWAVWQGMSAKGSAGQARRSGERKGLAWRGKAGKAGNVPAWRGEAGTGMAGMERRGREWLG